MTKKELNTWFMYCKQIRNGYHMSDSDYRELISLNHSVMEIAHGIHNDNMLGIRADLKKQLDEIDLGASRFIEVTPQEWDKLAEMTRSISESGKLLGDSYQVEQLRKLEEKEIK